MTEALADLLADRIRPLPFAERVVGLARPVDTLTSDAFEGKEQPRRLKTPMPVAYPAGTAACDRDERYLLPSRETNGIFFFEDRGTVSRPIVAGLSESESTLLLLGWLNHEAPNVPTENQAIDALWKALKIGPARLTAGDYQGLGITATVLPAEAALFTKYTYAAEVDPMLYPPYRLIGLELKCRYRLKPICVPAPPAEEVPAGLLPLLLNGPLA
ncbi:hypothetical protein [Hymenobacter properus]|uniref:Uncharacterized protein n=1 Tax=Hymenobacter properus TaxID=2791026 RepID=A0A931BJX8_9BACT|nr:hypothetical protein [Hymenobacter properus]MBF9140845.1 hypothetical protein [Hymenobacter properus]MBR7719654.1 hypothetical protein [Microvirga sp. SRT04]